MDKQYSNVAILANALELAQQLVLGVCGEEVASATALDVADDVAVCMNQHIAPEVRRA